MEHAAAPNFATYLGEINATYHCSIMQVPDDYWTGQAASREGIWIHGQCWKSGAPDIHPYNTSGK